MSSRGGSSVLRRSVLSARKVFAGAPRQGWGEAKISTLMHMVRVFLDASE